MTAERSKFEGFLSGSGDFGLVAANLDGFFSFFRSGLTGAGSGVLSRLDDGLKNDRKEPLLNLLVFWGLALTESDEVLSLMDVWVADASASTFSRLRDLEELELCLLDLLDLLLLELKARSGVLPRDVKGLSSEPCRDFNGFTSLPLLDLLQFVFELCSDFFSRVFGLSREPILLGPGFGSLGDSLVGGFLLFGESAVVVDETTPGFGIPIPVASREVVLMGMFARLSDEGGRGT